MPRNAGEDSEGSSSLLSLRPRFFGPERTGPNKRPKGFQQEKSDLVSRMEALLNAADDETRDLTADEETRGSADVCECGLAALDPPLKSKDEDVLRSP